MSDSLDLFFGRLLTFLFAASWFGAVTIDLMDNRLVWAFLEFAAFPVGMIRGIWLFAHWVF